MDEKQVSNINDLIADIQNRSQVAMPIEPKGYITLDKQTAEYVPRLYLDKNVLTFLNINTPHKTNLKIKTYDSKMLIEFIDKPDESTRPASISSDSYLQYRSTDFDDFIESNDLTAKNRVAAYSLSLDNPTLVVDFKNNNIKYVDITKFKLLPIGNSKHKISHKYATASTKNRPIDHTRPITDIYRNRDNKWTISLNSVAMQTLGIKLNSQYFVHYYTITKSDLLIVLNYDDTHYAKKSLINSKRIGTFKLQIPQIASFANANNLSDSQYNQAYGRIIDTKLGRGLLVNYSCLANDNQESPIFKNDYYQVIKNYIKYDFTKTELDTITSTDNNKTYAVPKIDINKYRLDNESESQDVDNTPISDIVNEKTELPSASPMPVSNTEYIFNDPADFKQSQAYKNNYNMILTNTSFHMNDKILRYFNLLYANKAYLSFHYQDNALSFRLDSTEKYRNSLKLTVMHRGSKHYIFREWSNTTKDFQNALTLLTHENYIYRPLSQLTTKLYSQYAKRLTLSTKYTDTLISPDVYYLLSDNLINLTTDQYRDVFTLKAQTALVNDIKKGNAFFIDNDDTTLLIRKDSRFIHHLNNENAKLVNLKLANIDLNGFNNTLYVPINTFINGYDAYKYNDNSNIQLYGTDVPQVYARTMIPFGFKLWCYFEPNMNEHKNIKLLSITSDLIKQLPAKQRQL